MGSSSGLKSVTLMLLLGAATVNAAVNPNLFETDLFDMYAFDDTLGNYVPDDDWNNFDHEKQDDTVDPVPDPIIEEEDPFDLADFDEPETWAMPEKEYIHENMIGNEFDEDDVFFSNQGAAGTCVRHAVAKGIQSEMIKKTNGRFAFHTGALVQWLVNHHKRGAGGAFTAAYDKASGQIVGDGGLIFSLEIRVHRVRDVRDGEV